MMNNVQYRSSAHKAPTYSSEKRAKFTHRENKKWLRFALVVGYVISVSAPAILLSLFYIFIWDPKYELVLPPPNMTSANEPFASSIDHAARRSVNTSIGGGGYKSTPANRLPASYNGAGGEGGRRPRDVQQGASSSAAPPLLTTPSVADCECKCNGDKGVNVAERGKVLRSLLSGDYQRERMKRWTDRLGQ